MYVSLIGCVVALVTLQTMAYNSSSSSIDSEEDNLRFLAFPELFPALLNLLRTGTLWAQNYAAYALEDLSREYLPVIRGRH